jgi:hypothetical protein
MERVPNALGWERVTANKTLYAHALTSDDKPDRFPWHKSAHEEHSSQVFCVSAFGTLRHLLRRDVIVAQLLTPLFPEVATAARPRQWRIKLEEECPALLGESGARQPTSIDAFLTSSREVVCIESKFRSDASDGFGRCSHAREGRCRGFYGPGSDTAGSLAWCRLENWDGLRAPRLYWSLAKAFFQPDVFRLQHDGETCPLRLSNYQLMRNFLFAAASAEQLGCPFFAVLAIAPRRMAKVIEEQAFQFRDRILLPQFQDRVRTVHYEQYIEILNRSGDDAVGLGSFLSERIETLVNGRAR